MRPLVLFDIDGTLVRTQGAGRASLDAAFAAVHGWENATEGVYIAGSTDRAILRDVGARFPGGVVDVDAVRERYLVELDARLGQPGRAEPCPGAAEAIVAVREIAHVALLTGNWERGAHAKLAATGLGSLLSWGAFADDALDRDDLLPVARARARERGLAVSAAIVIGDTPADVQCARVGGGLAVAVETGFAGPDELARCRPDLQLTDLAVGLPWLLALIRSAAERPAAP